MMKTLLALTLFPLAWCIPSCSPSGTTTTTPDVTSGVDYRQSKADVVVLSFFDMYCPQCQKDAKYVNQIHAATRQRGLGAKTSFFAIGWNNTPLESEMYRKRFNVPYPVIADKDLTISQRFGKIKPPLLIVLKKQGGQWKEAARFHGVRGKSEDILRRIQP
ncbi:MAG: redoxin domain-containing protein [Akkermansiaceae bacterium]|nr:redoxin domain-containing protein [Akkermansiaceae bacterium]